MFLDQGLMSSLLSILSVSVIFLPCGGKMQVSFDLHDHLLNPARYNPAIIPTCSKDDHVTVKIGVALRDIVEVIEKQQIIRIKVWVRLKWEDCMLQWDPLLFQNQTELVVPYSKIWIPDITLYEGVSDEENMPGMRDFRASIASNGNVMYIFPTILTITCRITVTYFPFDHQVCKLKFGSWIYSGKYVDLEKLYQKVDISTFLTHNEWDVVDTLAEKHNLVYICCPDPYPDITFYIHLKRKPIFYAITIIFPGFLINILTFMGFVLPPFSEEKITLHITVLLSTTVFLLLVQDKLPSSSEGFPFLAVYFAVSMGLVCISCVFSAIVMYLYYRKPEEHEIPWLVRYIFLDKLRVILCVKGEKVLNDEKVVQITDIRSLETKQSLSQNQCVEVHCGNESGVESGRTCSMEGEIPKHAEDSNKRQQSCSNEKHITNEWILFSNVLDRFFMLVYLCLTVANSLVFFAIINNYDGQDLPFQ